MRDRPDRLTHVADTLKWQMVVLALLAAGLYFLREIVLDSREELERARSERAKAKIDLDGALEALHEAQHGSDEPAGE